LSIKSKIKRQKCFCW